MVLMGKTPTEMKLSITLKATWAVKPYLELCVLCVLMEAKNRFHCVHNCLANLHAEFVDILWLFFVVIGSSNLKLQVGRVNYQLHRKDTIHSEQDVIAIT